MAFRRCNHSTDSVAYEYLLGLCPDSAMVAFPPATVTKTSRVVANPIADETQLGCLSTLCVSGLLDDQTLRRTDIAINDAARRASTAGITDDFDGATLRTSNSMFWTPCQPDFI